MAAAVAGLVVGTLLLPSIASAASAGLKPSEAPLIAVGQRYFGSARHVHNANWNTVEFWRLPPLLAADVLTIAWDAPGNEPPTFCLTHDIDDFNFAEEGNLCNGSQMYSVTSSGSSRSLVEAPTATANGFLEFWGNGCSNNCVQPYDFVIESIQHAIGVGVTPVGRLKPTSTLTGAANLSNGAPVPDGMAFTLTANWSTPVNHATHSRTYSAYSSSGALSYPLNLPKSAEGKKVAFTISRGADPQYLAAQSSAVEIPVARVRPRHHRRRHHRHRHHGRWGSAALRSAAPSKQECLAGLLRPPHVMEAVMYRPGGKLEVVVKLAYGGVEGCGAWQRLGKYKVQIKQPRGWADLEGNFWYPADFRGEDKNQAHKTGFLAFATHGIYEKCARGHWEPARVQLRNSVRSATTGKVVATGMIKNHGIRIEPNARC